MNTAVEKVVSEALELPPALRAFVAEKLIESLDLCESLALSARWRDEIRKRCKEIDEGGIELRDMASVWAQAYADLS